LYWVVAGCSRTLRKWAYMDYAVFDSLIDSVEEEEGQERRTRARER
jgi:hypothetical protein